MTGRWDDARPHDLLRALYRALPKDDESVLAAHQKLEEQLRQIGLSAFRTECEDLAEARVDRYGHRIPDRNDEHDEDSLGSDSESIRPGVKLSPTARKNAERARAEQERVLAKLRRDPARADDLDMFLEIARDTRAQLRNKDTIAKEVHRPGAHDNSRVPKGYHFDKKSGTLDRAMTAANPEQMKQFRAQTLQLIADLASQIICADGLPLSHHIVELSNGANVLPQFCSDVASMAKLHETHTNDAAFDAMPMWEKELTGLLQESARRTEEERLRIDARMPRRPDAYQFTDRFDRKVETISAALGLDAEHRRLMASANLNGGAKGSKSVAGTVSEIAKYLKNKVNKAA